MGQFIRRHMRHVRMPLYYLKMDVQNFFTTIDLNILYQIIEKHLENPLYRWLCKVVIFHRATAPGHFVLSSPKSLWRMMPRYKSLFYAPDNVGLPIGNLTSQFFANVYLGQFDQYVRHQLKGRALYWQRYVDDILFLSDRPEDLRRLIPLVTRFLHDELRLTINPKKLFSSHSVMALIIWAIFISHLLQHRAAGSLVPLGKKSVILWNFPIVLRSLSLRPLIHTSDTFSIVPAEDYARKLLRPYWHCLMSPEN